MPPSVARQGNSDHEAELIKAGTDRVGGDADRERHDRDERKARTLPDGPHPCEETGHKLTADDCKRPAVATPPVVP